VEKIKKVKAAAVMFLGEYQHVLDEKGRVALPVKFRTRLHAGAVVTRGLDNCLFIYPVAEWRVLADRLAALPIAQANTRAFARLMLAGAMETNVDKQGRMMVPDYLRSYAGLNRKVVVAGLYNRLELWSSDAWARYRSGTEENSVAIAEAMNNVNL